MTIGKKVKASPLPLERMYVLNEPFILGKMRIPKGFKWNGASIPRAFWVLIGSPFSPEFMRASLVHDFLYHRKDVSAKCTDKLFRDVLLDDGVGKLRAYTMWSAVRVYRIGK